MVRDQISPPGTKGDAHSRPVAAESAAGADQSCMERIGATSGISECAARWRILCALASANIPDLWLSDEEIIEKG